MKNIYYVALVFFLVSLFSCSKNDDKIVEKVNTKSEVQEIEEIYGKSYEVCEGMTNFYIKCANSISSIDVLYPEYCEKDNEYYLFLPANCNKNDLLVFYEADGPVYINNKWVKSGSHTGMLNGEINIITCGNFSYTLKVFEASSSVGSIYIETVSGNLDYVLENKENKEKGNIMCLNSDGSIIYDGLLKYIKGRGNYSWKTFPKNPFNIKLDKKADLTGSGKAKTFCLIANYQDDAIIKNKSFYDFSGKLGLYYANSKYYDVYINNHYYGLYQVTDKVEVNDTRIDITDLETLNEEANPNVDIEELPLKGNRSNTSSYDNGTIKYVANMNNPINYNDGYILEFEIPARYEYGISGFVSLNGQPVLLKSPEYASKEEVLYISSFYQDFENALYSGTGYNNKGKLFTDYIDIESFAISYILEEFSRNSDAGLTSFFMYKKGDKLICAPVWDFDNSLYSNRDLENYQNEFKPELYVASKELYDFREEYNKSGILTLFGKLYSQPIFRNYVKKYWEEKASKMIDDFIIIMQKNFNSCYDSIVMNGILWNKYDSKDYNTVYSKAKLCLNNYIYLCNERKELLNNYFDSSKHSIYYFSEYGTRYTIDTVSYSNEEIAYIKENGFKYSLKKFYGWNTKKDGSGVYYNPKDNVYLDEDLILYAIWK